MQLERLRRRPFVAIPIVIAALGLAAVAATGDADVPTEEVISLPGGEDAARPRPRPVDPPATTASTATTTPAAPTPSTPTPNPTSSSTGGGRSAVPTAEAPEDPEPTVPVGDPGTGPGAANVPGTDEGPAPAPTTSTTQPPPTTDVSFEHTYPAEHTGAVWIRVQATDLEPRVIRIQWGPYRREITHRALWPVTYVFEKGEGPTVPTTVVVSDGAAIRVTFGHGANPPLGSVDVNDGWITDPSEDEPAGP